MLPPDYFDSAADDLLDLYSQLDRSILSDIVRRLVKTGGVTDSVRWQAQRLQEVGLLYDDIIHEVASMSNASNAQVEALFQDAGIEAMKYDFAIYEAAGLSPIPIRQAPSAAAVLQAGMQKTTGHLRNLTMTTATTSQQAYIQAATLAEMQVESGAFDYVTAIRNAVRSASQAGSTVLYPTGWKDQLDVAVRRAALTGVSQTAAHLSLRYADDMDCDLVETTAHPGARPSHQVWQGKVFSRSGRHSKYPDFVASTGYGTGAGLCGWNCRHSFFPFFEGLSSSAYPRDKIQEYNNRTVEYNSETLSYYDATQQQRAMERAIRATKRDLAGADSGVRNAPDESLRNAFQENFNDASVKLKRQETELKDFLHQTGLDRQREREQVLGFGRSQSGKAVWANKHAIQSFSEQHMQSVGQVKTLNNLSESDIINKKVYRFTSRDEADKFFRPSTENIWPNLTESQKKAAYEYTSNSNPFNKPLRGYDGSWDNFVGVGKVPLDNEGYGKKIESLKEALEKSELAEDVWLFRGSDQQSLSGLLGIEKGKIIPSNVEALNKKFSQTLIRDPGFFSTGISSDAGFNDKISYEILAPKGTKGIYAEPFSAYGGTNNDGTWDGHSSSNYVSGEAEMLLQAGTTFEISEIKLINDKVTVVLKVVK